MVTRGHDKGSLTASRITLTGCEKLWESKTGDRGSTPLLHRGHVFALGRHIFPGKGGQFGGLEGELHSPIRLTDLILRGGVLLRATPENPEILGVFPGATGDKSTPAYAAGRLFVRDAREVRCYDLTQEGNEEKQPRNR